MPYLTDQYSSHVTKLPAKLAVSDSHTHIQSGDSYRILRSLLASGRYLSLNLIMLWSFTVQKPIILLCHEFMYLKLVFDASRKTCRPPLTCLRVECLHSKFSTSSSSSSSKSLLYVTFRQKRSFK